MRFATMMNIETDEQETARLAQSPEGSLNRELSRRRVTNPHPHRGQVLRLTHGVTVVLHHGGLKLVKHPDDENVHRPSEYQHPRQRGGSWEAVVVASSHPSCPAGGYDVSVSQAEARRSIVIDPDSIGAATAAAEGSAGASTEKTTTSIDPLTDAVEAIRHRWRVAGAEHISEVQQGRLQRSQGDVGVLLKALDAVRTEMRGFADAATECYYNGEDNGGSIYQYSYQRLERALDATLILKEDR